MRTLLVLLLFVLASVVFGPAASAIQDGAFSVSGAPMEVLGFRWSKSRQTVAQADNSRTVPAPAMIPANKNFQRNARVNDPVGVRDPNADTMDGRSAAMEKNVQDARAPKRKDTSGYTYQARIRNGSAKAVEVLFWEYQFRETANPSNLVRRQFLCGVSVKPGKEKELSAFSLAGPSDTISVQSMSKDAANVFEEKAVINRVEYADGSIWQRKDWSFAEVRTAVANATKTPWAGEMCRQL